MDNLLSLLVTNDLYLPQAEIIALSKGFEITQALQTEGFQLYLDAMGLQLFNRNESKQKPIHVDFVAGANAHRRKFGGGKGQAIAKAAGLKSGYRPSVIDGTSGLGKDAFVLASLGCIVTLVERHPVVSALLADGLQRAYLDAEIGDWMAQRMILSDCAHIEQLDSATQQVDVVYLDPMYPHRDKSALVKKDMRAFQSLVGSDLDADALLAPALGLATKRVVVKRPDYAEPLAQKPPTMTIDTKKNRFDVYVTKILK
jgi:16S rRNA (guanine1516-N2)-methyltransferase